MRGLTLLISLFFVACGSSDGGGGTSGYDGPEATEIHVQLLKCEDGEQCVLSIFAKYSTGEDRLEPPYSLSVIANGSMDATPVVPPTCDGSTLNDGRLGIVLAKAPPLQHIALRGCVRNDDSGELSPGATFLFDVPAGA